jgi:hypothetical protein
MKPSFSTARLAVCDLSDIAQTADARASLDAALPVILTNSVLRYLPPDLQHSAEGFDPQAWLATLTSRNDVGVVKTAADDRPVGFITLGNTPSVRVLEKAGFIAEPENSGDDWTVFGLPET